MGVSGAEDGTMKNIASLLSPSVLLVHLRANEQDGKWQKIISRRTGVRIDGGVLCLLLQLGKSLKSCDVTRVTLPPSDISRANIAFRRHLSCHETDWQEGSISHDLGHHRHFHCAGELWMVSDSRDDSRARARQVCVRRIPRLLATLPAMRLTIAELMR